VAVRAQNAIGWLGSFGRENDGQSCRESFPGHRVIAAMTVTHAASSFFLDVTHFTAGCHLAVASNDAAAGECGEAEKSNETHAVLNPLKQVQQNVYR
jgi:hypothetical protein